MSDGSGGEVRALADVLRQLHRRAGFPSLSMLSAATGIPRSSVANAWSGAHLPSLTRAQDLALALGASNEEFAQVGELWRQARAAGAGVGPALVTRDPPQGSVAERLAVVEAELGRLREEVDRWHQEKRGACVALGCRGDER